jgi:hypothetical protein
MTFTSKAQTWDNSQLNNSIGNTGMVELSEADLDAVSGGTLGLLLYAKISLVKSIFGIFGKHKGGYGDKDKHDDYDDHDKYDDKKKHSYGKKY